MKSFANKEINYSLHNSENYKKELESEITDVVQKISQLFIDYFKFIIENIKLKNSTFSRFIIIRGLDTIINVFNYILLYTKNIDLVYFHCQKAFYFYVEFVGQISEDEKMFLQLTSRDATTYVYKKTIFEINHDLKKNNEEVSDCTRLKIDIINVYIDVYKTLLLKIINDDFTNVKNLDNIELIYKKLNGLTNKINLKQLNEIIELLYHRVENSDYFFDVCLLLVKKIIKNQELINTCLNKFLSDEFKDKLHDTSDKFAAWLMS
jgi:phage-related protein